jgi:hypothetical protein
VKLMRIKLPMYQFFYGRLDLIILLSENSVQGQLEWVGPKNRGLFLGPEMATSYAHIKIITSRAI